MNRSRTCVLVSIAVVLSFAVSAPAADNWDGTWELNTAKSKYSPGPAPKSQTLKQETSAAGLKTISDSVDAAGKMTRREYVAKFDGKDYPWTGNPDADTISVKKIDDYTYEAVWKLKGKQTIVSRTVVSRDGKSRTSTQTGTDAQGRPVNNTLVYDKQ